MNRRAHRLLTLGLLLGLMSANASFAGEVLQRAEAARYAFIVTSTPEPSRLASVLATQYGFETLELNAPRREQIDEAMSSLFDRIRPYDQLIVHIGLPVTRGERTYFVPGDGDLDRTWTLLDHRQLVDWLNDMPTGSAFLTYPLCSASDSIDPVLEELNYSKRPGSVEILVACDFEAIRVQRRDPDIRAARVSEWRGDELGGAIADVLEGVASHDHGAGASELAITTAELLDRLGGVLESFEIRLVNVPVWEKPTFRFAHLGTTDEYRGRYEQAREYDELVAVVQDYIAAAGHDEPSGSALALLLRDIAVSSSAAAPSATLGVQEILQLRSYAADSLARMGSADARAALRAVVAGARDEGLIRRTALSALTQESEPEDLAVLRAAVEDPDSSVREAAVRGLVRARDEGAADLLAARLPNEGHVGVRISMIQALSGFGRDQDRETFIALLAEPSATLRKEAVAALSRLSPDDATDRRLLVVLDSDPAEAVRSTAAAALARTAGERPSPEIVAGLSAALAASTSEEVSASAATSLGRLGGVEAERALRAALADTDRSERVRVAAAGGLGRMKSVAAIPELEVASRAPSPPGLRRAAISALGSIGTPEVEEIIYSAQKDDDAYVRRVAQQQAEGLSLETPSSDLEDRVADLRSAEYSVRENAIKTLSRRNDPGTIGRLIEELGSTEPGAPSGAAAALGNLRSDDPRIVPALGDASRGASATLRAAAVRALGNHGEPGLADVLAAVDDSDAGVRLAAVAALRQIDSAAGRVSLEKLANGDPSQQVRGAAAEALSSTRYLRSPSKIRMKTGG